MSDTQLKTKILLGVSILAVLISHLLFLAQLDYVVYDHGDKHAAKPALEGYYQLKEGKISSFFVGMFGHHKDFPRYPAFIGYLTALACYCFGLNEVVMRALPLLFYLILIYYTYQCTKEIDSEEAGILSVLILITMPAIVFYSRLIFPVFFGMAFFMGAFYYLLRSNYFLNIRYSILFGLFTGLSLLTHRAMLIPVVVLWATAAVNSIRKTEAINSVRGFILSFLSATVISLNFLIGYFTSYDEYRDFSKYEFFNGLGQNYNFREFFLFPKLLIDYLGYDNLIILCVLMLVIFLLRGKDKKPAKTELILFRRFTIRLFCFFFGIYFLVIIFSEGIFLNLRYYQILAPPVAMVMAIYLNKSHPAIKHIVIFVKGTLLLSLLIMIMPQFGGSKIWAPFKKYYHIYNREVNGVLWSDRTFARNEELSYFKNEIAEGDIALMKSMRPHFEDLTYLGGRLLLNGIGREVSFEDAELQAMYLIFYCASYKKGEYTAQARGMNDSCERSILRMDEFINESIKDEIDADEKLAITSPPNEDRSFNVEIVEKYLTGLNFEKPKRFEYHTGNTKMYKVIFRCTEDTSALNNNPNFENWQKDWWFLRNFKCDMN